jgi:hypothetical protein
VLGLIGMVVFILAVISLAAAVTFAVVKLTPSGSRKQPAEADSGDTST